MNRILLRRLRALDRAELWALATAQLVLLWAAVLVRTRPVGRLISASVSARGSGSDPAEPPSADAPTRAEARRLARAVERAADHGVFRPSCLIRSVALQRILEARGIRGSRIHIGVRREDDEFLAHAWVEWQGEILGDRSVHVQRFAPLLDVQVASR